jgi:hypothetical protein
MRMVGGAAALRRVVARIAPVIMTGVVVVTLAGCSSGGDPSQGSLTITPGPYHNGQAIEVSVGPNKHFTPYASIKILECSDPGGTTQNLPTTALLHCDGNTIQGNTILVGRDGSFSQRDYIVYALPNTSALGEAPDAKPVCNETSMCVLYIGQNQENFSAPKMFSPPFTISGSGPGS